MCMQIPLRVWVRNFDSLFRRLVHLSTMLPRADNYNSLSRNNISSLQSSSNMNTDHPYILDILYNFINNCQKGKIYNLCCIPGHIGIHGNNETDKTAKSALDFKMSFLYETLWQIFRDFFWLKIYISFSKQSEHAL